MTDQFKAYQCRTITYTLQEPQEQMQQSFEEALRAEKPDLLTVVLPQSRSKQPLRAKSSWKRCVLQYSSLRQQPLWP